MAYPIRLAMMFVMPRRNLWLYAHPVPDGVAGAAKDGIYGAASVTPSTTAGINQQTNPPTCKDFTTTDPQLDLDTILLPFFHS